MILKFLNCQILYHYKTAYLCCERLPRKKKFPTHLSTIYFQKSGSHRSHGMRYPHLETVYLYQKLTQTFTEKIHQISMC